MFETILSKLKKKKEELKTLEVRIDKEIKETECLESKSKSIHNGIAKVNVRRIEEGLSLLKSRFGEGDYSGRYHYVRDAIDIMENLFISSIIEEK